jgi:hypothetical protein
VLHATTAMRFYLDVNTPHLTGGFFANHVFCRSKANMRTPISTEEHGKIRKSSTGADKTCVCSRGFNCQIGYQLFF